MKVFHCHHCRQLAFFENFSCVCCGRQLAWLPDRNELGSLDAAGDALWRSAGPGAPTYRLCENYTKHNVCNWAIPAERPDQLCRSCRLTRVIPNLAEPGARESWYRLEAAKRRLVYTLIELNLPIASKADDPGSGLAFEFLADVPGQGPTLTGHDEGVIIINLAEANDAEREKRRLALHEPYRTLLGHFRHEIGHYYWDRLIRDSPRLEAFRNLFGDDRIDYNQALERHYRQGAPPDWSSRFVTAYASSHPWEDWAETWAHYLHITDTLETAIACGLSLRPTHPDEPVFEPDPSAPALRPFDTIIRDWFPLTYVLNNLNRGLGLADGYPFVLSTPAIEKLRFLHDTVVGA